MTISAAVVADSIANDITLTTLQCRYPKFIHGEFLTHRVFSRNASSSRAIPVERLIKDVLDDPVYPMYWGKNQPGMQAREECNEQVAHPWGDGKAVLSRTKAWDQARTDAVSMARAFNKAGYHKQIVNRLLEPFCHINVVVTATNWENFFALRDHEDAQPEMQVLAQAIKIAIGTSTPKQLHPGQWHLPYFNDYVEWNDEAQVQKAIMCSIARCARVSYRTQGGNPPTLKEDMCLCEQLLGSVPLHASPAEHQATPDEPDLSDSGMHVGWKNRVLHGNLHGWIQYRKTLKGENVLEKWEEHRGVGLNHQIR